MATEHLKNNVTIRAFDVAKDTSSVKNIVSQVWGSGDDALMETRIPKSDGTPTHGEENQW